MANQPRYFNVNGDLWVFYNDPETGLTERHIGLLMGTTYNTSYDISHQFKVTKGYRGVKPGAYDVDMVVSEGYGIRSPEINYEGALQLLRERGLGSLEAYLPKG